MGNKTVAKLKIYIPIVGDRGKCSAGLGPGKKEGAESSLNFRKQLAKCMIFNKLGDNGVARTSPIRFERRNNQHELKRKLVGEGKWNAATRSFNTVKTHISKKNALIALKLQGNIVLVSPCFPCAGDALHFIWKSMAVETRSLLISTSNFWHFFGPT
jgi:hypothetical protein